MHRFFSYCLSACLHCVAGTTRGSHSQSQISATPASRSTKSPQFPTPHSTTHKSSKSMGKSDSVVSQLQCTHLPVIIPKVEMHKCLSTCVWTQPTAFTWQHVPATSAGCSLCSCLPTCCLFFCYFFTQTRVCFRQSASGRGQTCDSLVASEKFLTHHCSRWLKIMKLSAKVLDTILCYNTPL